MLCVEEKFLPKIRLCLNEKLELKKQLKYRFTYSNIFN